MNDEPPDDGAAQEPYRPPEAPKPAVPVSELILALGRMPTQQERLTLMDEEEVMDAVRSGVALRAIAASAGVTITAVREWLHSPCRSARYVRARQDAAQAYDELAEQAIIEAPATPIGIARARELAAHYRWRAKVVNPATYGDKVQATVTHDVVAELRDVIHARQSRLPVVEVVESDRDLVANESPKAPEPASMLALRGSALTESHSLSPDSPPVDPSCDA